MMFVIMAAVRPERGFGQLGNKGCRFSRARKGGGRYIRK